MQEIKFRAWHRKEKRLYERAFQKWFHVLLCRIEKEASGEEKIIPVKRASYGDCVLMQSTTLYDEAGKEIFEGDRVSLSYGGEKAESIVGSVPDMYRSRNLHPLQSVLEPLGLIGREDLTLTVVGNEYENIV